LLKVDGLDRQLKGREGGKGQMARSPRTRGREKVVRVWEEGDGVGRKAKRGGGAMRENE